VTSNGGQGMCAIAADAGNRCCNFFIAPTRAAGPVCLLPQTRV